MDYLIIGQGLAGTLIGYRLEQAGHRVHYADAAEQTAASSVAAGVINPITGRRFVRSWRIDELLPEARELYAQLENTLGVRLWHDLPLIRTLFNRGEQNDWLSRGGDPGYAQYLDDTPNLGSLPELTYPAFSYVGVRQTARVDLRRLVQTFRSRILATGRFTASVIDYGALPPGYDRYIFCEGWRARYNPYFNYLPHGGTKGEALLVDTGDAPVLKRMFKHRVFLVPQIEGGYWVGASSSNAFTDDGPTGATATFLEDRLREVLRVPYTVTAHLAAVRPTVRDRRMLLGRHPQHPELYIFNGLGTKGASLAPLGSKWLYDLLERGIPVPAEVSIDRFSDQGAG
ncbi:tRNA 5-methylaminomethyl-2-thiouridine biosynthesis bifunctional protein MnmC [Neolewinella maritima]|uniref:tRNA 5-methylaminomethyl-2-thiouridine biosynthesis bifunctional protein MnmC n=1 Tax=Neolewinella maritima TaxID=1383882 RepID=A0ABN8F7S8_9BACT|nr:FAD-dependent oxidoreductase [Neolewinella maritima]CAH1002047.1 tRNA 5-methylaminomethyl-2-thiouridine biosynthesis bifunctional protein MnmC [Neolewinella maritima]